MENREWSEAYNNRACSLREDDGAAEAAAVGNASTTCAN